MAPIYITFMLACHTSADPEAHLRSEHWGSSVGLEVRAWLLAQGLIDEHNCSTDRGKKWVGFICATPLPEQKWILPERNDNEA